MRSVTVCADKFIARTKPHGANVRSRLTTKMQPVKSSDALLPAAIRMPNRSNAHERASFIAVRKAVGLDLQHHYSAPPFSSGRYIEAGVKSLEQLHYLPSSAEP